MLVLAYRRDSPKGALPGHVHEPRRARRDRPGTPSRLEAPRRAALLLALALAFAAGALAHPRIRLSQPDQNATIVLLVDVSGSMRANDVEPTRLDAAVNAMRTFLDRLPKQFKVGLVAFSSEPEPLITPDLRTATASGRRSRYSSPRRARRSATGSPSG